MAQPKKIVCSECGKLRWNAAQGLCLPCYKRKFYPHESTPHSTIPKSTPQQLAAYKIRDAIRKQNPEFRAWRKQHELKKRLAGYGLTPELYQKLLEDGCQICGSHKALMLDHCHSLKVFRGILCRGCNLAVGIFKDNTELLHQAIKYLESYPYPPAGHNFQGRERVGAGIGIPRKG